MYLTLLAFILVTAIFTVSWGPKKNWPKEVYYFVGFSMLLFSFVYGITVLNWEIVGSGVSVKKAKEEVNQAKKEVNQAKEDVLATQKQLVFISTSTIELTDLAADCSRRFGGCVGDSKKEIERKQNKLLEYIGKINNPKSK